jgi:hypothetical protein
MAVVGAQLELCGGNRGKVLRVNLILKRQQPACITESCGHEVVEPEHIQASIAGREIGRHFLYVIAKDLRQLEVVDLDAGLLGEAIEDGEQVLLGSNVGPVRYGNGLRIRR